MSHIKWVEEALLSNHARTCRTSQLPTVSLHGLGKRLRTGSPTQTSPPQTHRTLLWILGRAGALSSTLRMSAEDGLDSIRHRRAHVLILAVSQRVRIDTTGIFPTTTKPQATGSGGFSVAGAGFEPATFGL